MSLILSSSFFLYSIHIQVTNDFLVIPLILFHCISVTVQTNILLFAYIPFTFRLDWESVLEEPPYPKENYGCHYILKYGHIGA